MSQPSNSPPATPGSPQESAAPGSRAGSFPAGSPPPSPNGMPAQSPVRTPARAAGANAAGMSPNSNASMSPAFARTPRSGGSPAQSPLAGPVRTPLSSPTRTPARRPLGGAAPSPTGSLAGRPAAPSPANSVRSRNTPGGTSQPRVAHRGFMGSSPKTPARNRDADMMDDAEEDLEDKAIYGTTIKQAQVVKEFHAFIRGFRLEGQTGERPYYLQQLHDNWEQCIKNTNGIKFPISGEHVRSFNKRLYDRMVNWPTEVIPIFDWELWNISVRELNGEPEEMGTCQVQIHSLMDTDSRIMRNMNPTDIERLMSLKGIVIRCSDLVPDMMSATFRCTSEDCKHEVSVALSHWSIEEPTKCESCGATHSYQIVHNECTFMDRQVLKLQETPELVPEGETPQNIQVICFDDLVDTVRPGDRVEVTGIYKASAVRPIKNWNQCSSVYRTYVDAISIAAERKGRIDAPVEEYDFESSQKPAVKLSDKADLDPELNGEEDIRWNEKVRALAAEMGSDGNPTIIRKLVESFAPSIFEEDEVKKGVLCQLFGGTPKPHSLSSKGRCRPEIHQLLCGDPSTAKSQIIQFAYKLAPRGIYTSGKGSSAVGLTASINTDPITKELVLESGALVLSDRGLCCIDEFDKMDENARAILHEAMEQQTVSVAKAGIVCSLNARTSILASANPKDSAYDPKMSVVDNIALPKNLMTRFDFIWLMIDQRNREKDHRLGEHLVAMYSESGAKKRPEPPIDSDLFRRYISFARRWCFPQLTDASAEALAKGYTDLRHQGGSREVITATPRILESLIRISEALAKMELREEVSTGDVDEAIRLMKAATYAAAVDPETGLIDMEQLIVGVGAARRKRSQALESALQELLVEKAADGQLSTDHLGMLLREKMAERKENLPTEGEFNAALRAVEQAGLIRRQGKTVELKDK